MTAQEALRYIKYATSLKLDFNGQGQIVGDNTIEELRQVIISALEKEIQEEPRYVANGYFSGEPIYDICACPNCGKCYEVDYDDYKHCPECGQALDWSDTE